MKIKDAMSRLEDEIDEIRYEEYMYEYECQKLLEQEEEDEKDAEYQETLRALELIKELEKIDKLQDILAKYDLEENDLNDDERFRYFNDLLSIKDLIMMRNKENPWWDLERYGFKKDDLTTNQLAAYISGTLTAKQFHDDYMEVIVINSTNKTEVSKRSAS